MNKRNALDIVRWFVKDLFPILLSIFATAMVISLILPLFPKTSVTVKAGDYAEFVCINDGTTTTVRTGRAIPADIVKPDSTFNCGELFIRFLENRPERE